MIDSVNTIFLLLKFLIAFIFIYIFIPSRIIRFDEDTNTFLDKFFISFINSTFIIIIIVHILSFIKVYETLSMLFCIVVLVVFLPWIKAIYNKEPPEIFGIKSLNFLFDISDIGMEYFRNIRIRLQNFLRNSVKRFKSLFKQFFFKPFSGILLFPVLIFAVVLRFNHSLSHLYLGASDSYLHLVWVKYLGENNIYGRNMLDGGIYSYGLHAVVSATNKIIFMDPLILMRFIGPLTGFLIVLSIYYVLKRNFKNDLIPWLAILLYLIGSWLPGYDFYTWRQISTLPEMFSFIFFLPGLHYFNVFINSNKRFYLILSGQCLALTVFIHPYVTFFLCIGYLVIALVNIRLWLKFSVFIQTALMVLISILLGFTPFFIGRFQGITWHPTFNYVKDLIKVSSEDTSKLNWSSFFEIGLNMKLFFIGVLIILSISLLSFNFKGLKNRIDHIKFTMTFAILSILFYFIYKATEVGLFSIIRDFTIQMFIAIVMVITIAIMPDMFISFLKQKKAQFVLKVLAYSFIALVAIYFYKPYIPKGIILEYDDSVRTYFKIKSEFSPKTWTIISPVEEYSKVLGYGYHTEISLFAQQLSEGVKKEMPAGTDNVFIYVEKIPLYNSNQISLKEAKKDFPAPTKNNLDNYTKPDRRMIIESKVYFWAENYMKSHNNMKIYSDSKWMRIYYFKQDRNKPLKIID